MATGALLMIWIGLRQAQTLAVDHFASMAECEAARAAIIAEWGNRPAGKCLPYTYAAPTPEHP